MSLEPGVRLRSAIVVTHGCALDPLLGGLSALIGGRTYRIAAIDGAVALVREEAEATIDLLVQREQQPPFLGALVSARQALEPLHEAWRAEYLGFSELTVGSLSAAGPCITARIDGLLHVSPSRMPPAAYSYLVPFDASPYACALTGTLLIAPLAAEPPVLADGAPSRAADAGSLPARRVDGGVSVCPGPGGEDGGTRRIPATDAGVPGCVCGEASLCRP